ncbi:histidine phosphatase family protein [Puteibacter caeruleilacunae]|nr:histidine phosphatase family protein [Puteibacter caeruleilacunae]
MANIYICRHCKTSWNKEHRVQGTINIPLSEEGKLQATENLQYIQSLGIQRIITSESIRAFETGKIYADHLKVPINTHSGLGEIDHGAWEGELLPELLSTPSSSFKQWMQNPLLVEIPSSKETIHEAQKRIVTAVEEIRLGHKNENVLIVTHKHIKALLYCELNKQSVANFSNNIEETIRPTKI